MQIREQTEVNHKLDSEYSVAETNISHTREMIAAAEGACESTKKSIEKEYEAERARRERIAALEVSLEDSFGETAVTVTE